jgi:2-alkyl-3-oxoalkanoate reductase
LGSSGCFRSELDVGQRFANGYEFSKAEAERLVRAAQQQGGISAVARPSIVVGRYCDGTIGQFTNIYALIRLVTAAASMSFPPALARASTSCRSITSSAG